ncbi:MAG: hypothetical protein JO247_22135, partial [Chloroflexi bacterium]|nr:hypothetical protein [Chloroflexota bacterium]
NCALLERAVGDDDRLHMTLNETGEHIRRLRQEGILRLEGVALGTHFSHRSQPDHDTVDALLRPYGLRAAFDGLQLSLQPASLTTT